MSAAEAAPRLIPSMHEQGVRVPGGVQWTPEGTETIS